MPIESRSLWCSSALSENKREKDLATSDRKNIEVSKKRVLFHFFFTFYNNNKDNNKEG